MNRRDILKRTGTVALGSLLVPGTVAGQREGEAPNDNVNTEQVSIFAPKDDPKQISAGSWINHRWGWVDTSEGSSEANIERWLESVELTILIDGEEIQDIEQYWGEIYQNEEGQYITYWEYVTRPKSPGLHTFTVEFYYPDGFKTEDGQYAISPETHYTFTGHYEIS